MVMGDTRIEALDNSLFDKLQVFDGDISPMLEPDNNAIAIAVSLDDYGNLPNPEYYPKVGDTITATYADDVKYIDSRTGELRTEDTPEEYRQKKLYGARDVEYTVCALGSQEAFEAHYPPCPPAIYNGIKTPDLIYWLIG